MRTSKNFGKIVLVFVFQKETLAEPSEDTNMERQFEVRCEYGIWTVRRDGILFGEHEEQSEAETQAEKLARWYQTSYVMHNSERHHAA
jgi:hypothetical protein